MIMYNLLCFICGEMISGKVFYYGTIEHYPNSDYLYALNNRICQKCAMLKKLEGYCVGEEKNLAALIMEKPEC